ncbi:MAG: thioredoxin family protein [Fuerstiella sp.]
MRNQSIAALLALSVSFMAAANGADIGDVVPAWQGLRGTDNQLHGLDDYQDARFVVVAFLCNKCPCVKGYEGRFNRFAQQYADKGVRFVGINSSLGELENLNEMKSRSTVGRYSYDYLRDEDQAVGRSFGALKTPHVFILDQNRRIVYSGAFDDNRIEAAVRKHYVTDAINALLAGRSVPLARTHQFGCAITYR